MMFYFISSVYKSSLFIVHGKKNGYLCTRIHQKGDAKYVNRK